jgi:hypothetical protein
MEIAVINTKDVLMIMFLIDLRGKTATRIADNNGTAISSNISSI